MQPLSIQQPWTTRMRESEYRVCDISEGSGCSGRELMFIVGQVGDLSSH